MPITYKKEECTCGRPIAPQHCPGCGSTNLYARRANDTTYIAADNTVATARGFRCRRCGMDFNALVVCDLPRYETESMRQRRAQDAAKEATIKAMDNAVVGLTDPAEIRKRKLELLFKISPPPGVVKGE